MVNNRLEIIGHRGAAGLAPENSQVAFEKAVALKLPWVEIDVVVTSDDVAVIFHDDSLDRCSDSSGLLCEKPWAELASIDIGSWFDLQYQGQRLLTFSDVLLYLRQHNIGCHVELKLHAGVSPERLVASAGRILHNETNENIIVSAFNPRVLTLFHQQFPHFRKAILLETALPLWHDWALACAAEAVHIDDAVVTLDFVQQCHDLGLLVRVFTVNDTTRAKTLALWGVSGIFTDFPNRFVLNGVGYAAEENKGLST